MSFNFCKVFVTFLLFASATAAPSASRRDGSSVKIATPISVPTKLKINNLGSAKDLIQNDLARAKALMSKYNNPTVGQSFKADAEPEVPTSNTGTHHTAEVAIGTPPKTYNLLIDTGSSNTFISVHGNYQQTSSSMNTTHKTTVSYGSGKFEGFEFTDTVTLGGASIDAQSIGVSQKDQGLEELDGLLGLGPDDLTEGTVEGEGTIPTVTDNLVTQGKIPAGILGISFIPTTNSQPTVEGSLDFGAPDASKFTGDLTYVHITGTNPASTFWGIDQSVSYGESQTEILKSTAGIVDSGTTLLMLATDAYNAYVSATGATFDNATGLLKVDSADSLQSLFFHIGESTFEFTANAQIWPRSLNTAIGGDASATYLIISDLKTPSGKGLDFINGFTFMQRFYTVHDTPGKRMGFATTAHTHDTSN